MIARVIGWSAANRYLVFIAAAFLALAGTFAALRTPLDAIPDLSDVQVVIRTPYAGQAPEIVETQVTYPLATTMLSAPGVKAVRGVSFFGDSYVTVLFDDRTDLYWARSRTLEYLSQAIGRLPPGVTPALGPDATGVGWVYEYALVDRSGRHDLGQLRATQDWFLKYALKEVPGVAEVATVGGMVRSYQVQVDPERLQIYRVPVELVIDAVKSANAETGGSVLQRGEAEYMVRSDGYLKTLDDFRQIPLSSGPAGAPVTVGDVARVQLAPDFRRGVADLNGQGEVVGGVIVARTGVNALEVIKAVKAKIEQLKPSLPPGVEVVPVYDRSGVIKRAVSNLNEKLVEEFLVVALVCALFLLHLRSAFVAIVTLPLGILAALLLMRLQGVNANIMSLGGIAIAIGAMVDAAVVMIENAHKKLEHHAREVLDGGAPARRRLLIEAAVEVGPALFFSLVIITLSFLPIFMLGGQEGKLFKPLALTKTYAMGAAAILSVTLVPALMTVLIRGRIRAEAENPISRGLIAAYRPALRYVLARPRATLLAAAGVLLLTLIPLTRLGGEFMPPLFEGDLLYMPTALPGLSADKAGELLQRSDAIIKSVPEIETVFGKAGRAETATDPAPLEMFETTVQLKPREQWRPGLTPETLIADLDRQLQIPGLANVWVQPIRNRIDMLSTGIKTPIGVKITGPDLGVLQALGADMERILRTAPGTQSVVADRIGGGRYVDIRIDRAQAARYGLAVKDIQTAAALVVGGAPAGEKVEGLARFPITVRYPREMRDSVQALQNLPLVSPQGAVVPLGAVATVAIAEGPAMIRSENARPSMWVYVDVGGRDIVGYVRDARAKVARELRLPPGYAIAWSGQYEYLQHAMARLAVVAPITLAVIFGVLVLAFRRVRPAVIILLSLPFALVGGVWLVFLLGHAVSVASIVGFIALAGLAAEFGVVMLVYLDRALAERERAGTLRSSQDLDEALIEGAVLRVRPKAMTVAVILVGLLPLLLGHGAGSEVMQRIAAPMIGGMLSAPLLSLFVMPVVYRLLAGGRVASRPRYP